MIEAIELTSRGRGRSGAGPRPVVNHVSFDVYPGQVTALLGAPGVGKSSVLRMMTQQEPAKGRTLFGGRPYRALRPAVREVGLALDPDALHPGRTVRQSGIGVKSDHIANCRSTGCQCPGIQKARVPCSAQQAIQFEQFTALSFPTHPDLVDRIPEAAPMQQVKANPGPS